MHEERLRRFLQGLDGMGLPAEFGAALGGEDVHGDFADEARKGQLQEEEVVGALVFADFFEGYGAGFVAMAAAGGGGVSRCWNRGRSVWVSLVVVWCLGGWLLAFGRHGMG